MERLPEETERTPRGHDLSLLREMLDLTPEERIERNVQFVALIEELRGAKWDLDGPPGDLPPAR